MFAAQNKGVLFFEQVLYLKRNIHTVIECIPIPAECYETAPAFIKESILSSAEEWSQHKKIIETNKENGGFRKRLVPVLPYFHAWLDPNRGIGHVIENESEWPKVFSKEIVGGMLGLEQSAWRKLGIIDRIEGAKRRDKFWDMYRSFDWTAERRE